MVTYVNRDINLLYWDKSASGAAVLIVTNDDVTRQSLREGLEGEGYRVLETRSGEDALMLCAYEDFNGLLLVDENLPGMDACETARQIKALNRDTPVVVLAQDDGILEEIFDSGAVDYVPKPVRPLVLRQRLRHLLKLREAQNALQINEERYRNIAGLASDYAYESMLTADGHIQLVWVTEGFEQITGYVPQDLPENGLQGLIHPDDAEKFKKRVATLSRGEPDTSEFRILRQNGEIRWISERAYPVYDKRLGNSVRVYSVVSDITQEKNAEDEREYLMRDLQVAVRQAEEATALIDAFFTGANVGLAYFDKGIRYRRLNHALARINGLPIWEHFGKTPRELLPDVEIEGTETMFQRVIETGEAIEFETSGYTPAKPGELRHWLASYYPIMLREEVLGIGAVVIDITARKRAEEELRYSTQRLRAALKGSPVVVFSQDLELRYTWMDFPYPGIETAQIIGKRDSDFMDNPEEAAHVEALKRQAVEQGVGQREEVRMHFNGELHHFDLTIEPLYDEEGNIEGITCAAIDVTQRKKDQEMLQQQAAELQARNAELDAFAYTVAHDLKNPIATMMGFASLIQAYHSMMSDDDLLDHIQQIMEGGYKLRSIIDALLLLAGVNKMSKPDLEILDMNEIIRGAEKRLMSVIGETNAEIILPKKWPVMFGYAPWVEEVIANYFSNALKYGGTPPRVEFGATKEGKMVRVWVRDNGRGLTPEEQGRVFTPFTRLNQVKIEGHGLGLSIVERIVGKLGGEVGVESVVGEGSTFSFTLPTQK